MRKTSSKTTGLSVGQLARAVGLSRSALLYYDRIRLLRPGGRSRAGYRLYTQEDHDRCQQICFFRKMGIPLADIAGMLAHSQAAGETGHILERRLHALEAQIETLQEQQRGIVRLLEQLSLPRRSERPLRKTSETRRMPRARAVGAIESTRNSQLSKENIVISKERWVEIMIAAGFTEQNMREWHRTFERMEPEGHQELLESLSIPKDEIVQIREWSRR